MKILERLSNNIGSGKNKGIYEVSDGKHFCLFCGELIRSGQEVIESWMPDVKYRRTIYRYEHVNCSPNNHFARNR